MRCRYEVYENYSIEKNVFDELKYQLIFSVKNCCITFYKLMYFIKIEILE